MWRTVRRVVSREELWNGNRESLRNVLFSRDSLILFALRNDAPAARYPRELARYRVARSGPSARSTRSSARPAEVTAL